jgi:predicted O-methyltransferase YrrM
MSRADALLAAARAARGFMPDDEGVALARAARLALETGLGPLVEVGAYCGKSTLYLASALAGLEDDARAATRGGARRPLLFSVDHHRGSEENQPGWPYHEPDLVDTASGRIDTLPHWRRTVEAAGAEPFVVGIVGESSAVASWWRTPCALVFIDGGHGEAPAWADYRGWAPAVATGGLLAIHDVFPDPAEGGRPPYEIYLHALASGAFCEETALHCGSLRVLRRVDRPLDTERAGGPGKTGQGRPSSASSAPRSSPFGRLSDTNSPAASPSPRSAESASTIAAAE